MAKRKQQYSDQVEIARLERDAALVREIREFATSPAISLVTMFAVTNLASRAQVITGEQAVIIQTAVSTGQFAQIAQGIIGAIVPG